MEKPQKRTTGEGGRGFRRKGGGSERREGGGGGRREEGGGQSKKGKGRKGLTPGRDHNKDERNEGVGLP